MKITSLFIFLLLYASAPLFAQTDSLDILSELSDADDGLAERIQELSLNPINLNSARAEDLALIPFLTGEDIDSLLAYKIRNGGFSNSDSIREILGNSLYKQIRPFITIGYMHRQGLSFIQKNYQGDNNPGYNGSRLYNYSKLIYRRGYKWAAGAIIQKDPGERNYIDHLHGAVQYRSNDTKFIIGDFYLRFGQGLLFSNLYGTRKSILTAPLFRDLSLAAYMNLSSSEFGGKFGMYASWSKYRYKVFGFISRQLYDARMDGTNIRGIRTDGYHRTKSEILASNRIEENARAIGISANWQKLKAGILISRYQYTPGFNLERSQQDARRYYYSFQGRQLSAGSISYSYSHGAYRIAGEAAFSKPGTMAFQQSVFYGLRNIKAGIKFWSIYPEFQSPDGRMFDNAAPFPNADQGYLASLQIRMNKHWSLAGYKVFRQKLWRGYTSQMPLQKGDGLAELHYRQAHTDISLRFRRRESDDFPTINTRILNIQDNIRIEVRYHPKGGPLLRTRLEKTFFTSSAENGTLFFQDISVSPLKNIKLSTRLIFYKTTSFNSRIYEFEKDIPGSFANYPLYGQGHLIYVMIGGRFGKLLRYYIKWRMNFKNSYGNNGRSTNHLDTVVRSGLILHL